MGKGIGAAVTGSKVGARCWTQGPGQLCLLPGQRPQGRNQQSRARRKLGSCPGGTTEVLRLWGANEDGCLSWGTVVRAKATGLLGLREREDQRGRCASSGGVWRAALGLFRGWARGVLCLHPVFPSPVSSSLLPASYRAASPCCDGE